MQYISDISNLFMKAHINQKEDSMRVRVNSQCMGDRNCNLLCPEVFEYDEDELMSIVKKDPIPEHLEAVVQQAVDECGAEAIEVIE